MYQEQRLEAMLAMLKERSQLSAKEMVEHFQVSKDTIRRDFALLDQRGLVRRTHGGILPLPKTATIPAFEERKGQLSQVKQTMAQKALELIDKDDLIFLDVSTLTLALAEQLDKPTIVYTHSLDNALVLSAKTAIDSHLIGGKFYAKNRFYYDPQETRLLEKISVNLAFYGAASLAAGQVSYEDAQDVAVKEAVFQHAQTKVLLAECQKWDRQSTYILSTLTDFDYWICDQEPPQEIRDQLPQNLTLIY